jgi:hypothetical protein
MAYQGVGGYPNWLVDEYPGLEGISSGIKGFNYLLKDPGFKQLATSSAADPAGQGYQAASDAGIPASAAPGLFGQLIAGQMGADVAGQAAQSKGQNAAQNAKVGAGQAAGNLMANQQSSQLDLEKAQASQAMGQLGGFSSILNMLTNPKGIGANIMGLFTGSNADSPLGGLFSKLFSGGDLDPLSELGVMGTGGSMDPDLIAAMAGGV